MNFTCTPSSGVFSLVLLSSSHAHRRCSSVISLRWYTGSPRYILMSAARTPSGSDVALRRKTRGVILPAPSFVSMGWDSYMASSAHLMMSVPCSSMLLGLPGAYVLSGCALEEVLLRLGFAARLGLAYGSHRECLQLDHLSDRLAVLLGSHLDAAEASVLLSLLVLGTLLLRCAVREAEPDDTGDGEVLTISHFCSSEFGKGIEHVLHQVLSHPGILRDVRCDLILRQHVAPSVEFTARSTCECLATAASRAPCSRSFRLVTVPTRASDLLYPIAGSSCDHTPT